jgi:hypothetical protein
MPVKLSTTLEKIDKIENIQNQLLIKQYHKFMVSTGASSLEEQLKLTREKLQAAYPSDGSNKLKEDVGFPPIDFSKMFKDAGSLIEVEYQSASSVVLRGNEENLLLLNGTLVPFWHAIDIVKKHGYQLKEITESGMGSQGNPTRFYAILEK